jgi:transcriptional regulator with XRE-family HTH domain
VPLTEITLRDLRRRRGFSLEAVAYLAELDQSTISRLERGLIYEPKPETVVTLARAYGVTVARMSELIRAGGSE